MIDQALAKLEEIKTEIGEKKSRHVVQPRNIEDLTKRPGTMRRGMLMTVLQQYSLDQPVWRGKANENPPPLCGAIPAEEKHKCRPDDQVAARVNTETGEDDQWILAVVVSYNSHYHRYHVDDIDEEGHIEKKRYQVSKRRVIPLPIWKADPVATPQALFREGQKVLALYPQTTCFYPAIIHELPKTVDEEYSVLFEDNTYLEGYSPPLDVPQRYVLPMRETRRRQQHTVQS
jgi:SAGA-associated factor 29